MKIIFVCADDWEGIYVDGELKAEGHSLTKHDILTAVGQTNYISIEADEEWLDKECYLPLNLKDVKHKVYG